MVIIFTFQFSIFVFFFYPSLFHSFAFLHPLGLLYWNLGVIFVYTYTCWQNRELDGMCLVGDTYGQYSHVRKYSLRCVTWPHSDLISTPNQSGLNLKSGAYLEPRLPGWICIDGAAGRAGGSDAAGRTAESATYSPPRRDTEAQQQVPGAGRRLPPALQPRAGILQRPAATDPKGKGTPLETPW